MKVTLLRAIPINEEFCLLHVTAYVHCIHKAESTGKRQQKASLWGALCRTVEPNSVTHLCCDYALPPSTRFQCPLLWREVTGPKWLHAKGWPDAKASHCAILEIKEGSSVTPVHPGHEVRVRSGLNQRGEWNKHLPGCLATKSSSALW